MAGSWNHMTTSGKGKFLNNENFCGMIENLGDAYEAAEECYGMVWWLAERVAFRDDPTTAEAPSREAVLDVVRQAIANYKDGLKLGGVQQER